MALRLNFGECYVMTPRKTTFTRQEIYSCYTIPGNSGHELIGQSMRVTFDSKNMPIADCLLTDFSSTANNLDF